MGSPDPEHCPETGGAPGFFGSHCSCCPPFREQEPTHSTSAWSVDHLVTITAGRNHAVLAGDTSQRRDMRTDHHRRCCRRDVSALHVARRRPQDLGLAERRALPATRRARDGHGSCLTARGTDHCGASNLVSHRIPEGWQEPCTARVSAGDLRCWEPILSPDQLAATSSGWIHADVDEDALQRHVIAAGSRCP